MSQAGAAIGVVIMLIIIGVAVLIGLYATGKLGDKATDFFDKQYNELMGTDSETGGTTDSKDPLPPAQPTPDSGPPCDPSIVSSPCYISPDDYKARCVEKATELGLDAKHSGFSGIFANKGCYYYPKDAGTAYDGKAYFSAGTIEEMSGPLTHNTDVTTRIDITDFKKLKVTTDEKGNILQ